MTASIRQIGSVFILWAACVSSAEARRFDARITLPIEQIRTAVHIPTGCMARLSLRGDALLTAMITDPACLPQGVSARHVPASLTDFGAQFDADLGDGKTPR